MKLEDGCERVQDGLPYRTAVEAEAGFLGEPQAWVLQVRHQGQWKGLYRFTLETAAPADFEVGNHFHLTSLEGEVLAAEETLSRSRYGTVLEEQFGIVLPGPAVDRLWNLEPSVSRGNTPLP